MNAEAYGTTIFCDDIRFEKNGKLTLVGCYAGALNFFGPAPGRLPRFAALVNLRIRKDIEFRKVKLVVLKEVPAKEEEIFSTEIVVPEEQKKAAVDSARTEPLEERVFAMNFPLQWSEIEFAKPGIIKVRAFIDDGPEIRLGAIKVSFSPSQNETDSE